MHPTDMHRFLTELRRRKVTRAVIAYGFSAFAIIEAVELAAPRVGLPDEVVTWLVWLAVIGLPVVAAGSWFFDMTPDLSGPESAQEASSGAAADRDEAGSAPVAVPSAEALRRARLSAALATAATLLLVWGAWTTLALPRAASASAVVEGAERIAILPFRPAATDPELTQLGRNIAVTMSTAVEAVGEVRTADPAQVLGRIPEEGGPLTPEEALSVGRFLGATAVVSGSVVRDREGAGVEFRLLATDDGRELARGSVDASDFDLYRLTDAATVELLRGVWRQGEPPTENLDALTTASIDALSAFLEGERYYREFDFPAAVPHYERAAELDTAFALPHWRLSWMDDWLGGNLDIDPALLSRHERLYTTLPPRERMHAVASLPGEDRTEWLQRYERLVQEYPDYALGQFQYGDVLFHYAALLGWPLEAVDSVWEESMRLGATDEFALDHYLTRAMRARDLDRWLAVAEVAGVPPERMDWLRTVAAVQMGLEPFAGSEVEDSVVAGGDDELISWAASYLGTGLPTQAAYVLSLIGEPSMSRNLEPLLEDLRITTAAAGGRFREALERARGLAVAGRPGGPLQAYRIAVVAAALGAIDYDEAAALRPPGPVRSFQLGALGAVAAPEGAASQARAFADGYLALLVGDADGLRRAHRELSEEGGVVYLQRALELHEELKAGTPGAVERMVDLEYAAANERRLDSPEQIAWYLDVVGLNRAAALEGLLEAERYAEAERLSRVTGFGLPWGGGWPRAFIDPVVLPYRGRALMGLGRYDEARVFYRDFLERMEDPDPAFDDEVAAARAALQQLDGEGAGV